MARTDEFGLLEVDGLLEVEIDWCPLVDLASWRMVLEEACEPRFGMVVSRLAWWRRRLVRRATMAVLSLSLSLSLLLSLSLSLVDALFTYECTPSRVGESSLSAAMLLRSQLSWILFGRVERLRFLVLGVKALVMATATNVSAVNLNRRSLAF